MRTHISLIAHTLNHQNPVSFIAHTSDHPNSDSLISHTSENENARFTHCPCRRPPQPRFHSLPTQQTKIHVSLIAHTADNYAPNFSDYTTITHISLAPHKDALHSTRHTYPLKFSQNPVRHHHIATSPLHTMYPP
ncbi:hypothetical protein AVEN_175600-1 [Araneus ventricosus]|uniref:Uncharacterized protein n=1 Tax=Araneus ventricosus TaxID=182803 RepID=A0A4Y2G246_ARAVE|nr:hypothetical protein AVEN_175600-1 [Araneus ventricosus]